MQAQVAKRYSRDDECAKATHVPPLPAVAAVTVHVSPCVNGSHSVFASDGTQAGQRQFLRDTEMVRTHQGELFGWRAGVLNYVV